MSIGPTKDEKTAQMYSMHVFTYYLHLIVVDFDFFVYNFFGKKIEKCDKKSIVQSPCRQMDLFSNYIKINEINYKI